MKREVVAYGDYYDTFMKTSSPAERKKIHYILDLLSIEDRVSTKFVKYIREGIYELRAMYSGNIYRFFSSLTMTGLSFYSMVFKRRRRRHRRMR